MSATEINKDVYRNFRCIHRVVNNTFTPICEYVLRAKRVNVFPNGVSLVYMDDHRELANPVYPGWLQLWANGATKGICDAPEAQPNGQLFPRSYVNVHGDCTDYHCPALNSQYGPLCDCLSPLLEDKCQ